MQWLNYHHLYYFWVVAREGSIARCARVLRLTEPTVSAQIHALEDVIGEKLFRREGRALVLTEAGRVANRYANDIFALGQELRATLATVGEARDARLAVGITDAIPRRIAFRLLEPALRSGRRFAVSCHSDSQERLITKLVNHEVDLVFSNEPLDGTRAVGLYSVLLGESDVTIHGTRELAKSCKKGFPRTLDGKPFLLPTEGPLRRALDRWFRREGIRPDIRGELNDSSLLKAFGREGQGFFAAPSVIARETARDYRVQAIGRVPDVVERYYVVSTSRKTSHPAVAEIWRVVRNRTFSLTRADD